MKKILFRFRLGAMQKRTILRVMSVCLVAAMLVCTGAESVLPVAHATKTEDLNQELADLDAEIAADKKELEELKDTEENEEARKENIEGQIEILVLKMQVLQTQITQTRNNIQEKTAQIEEKTVELTEKQAEYDTELELFRERLAAMQEMNDNGTIAILSAVENLYQLLTFGQTLQDISDKNTEILNNLETQRDALDKAKTALEEAKASLEAEYTLLEAQSAEYVASEEELKVNLKAVNASIETAQALQEQIQENISANQIKYNEVAKELETLINGAEDAHDDLVMTDGFIVPLPAGAYRISQYFSAAHPAIDYAAGAWTPIYASAAGYVTAAGWNNGGYGNYVLIYHGQKDDNTYSSLYAHMVQAPSVSAGQYVEQGTLIGYVGNTGYSFGNHLHYELWAGSNINNSVANKAQRVNPLEH